MFKYKDSAISHSRYGCFDADYEGEDTCPLCERAINLHYSNWNDGRLPFAPDSRSKVCVDCYYVVDQLKEFPPAMLEKFLRKAKKWTGIKRLANK